MKLISLADILKIFEEQSLMRQATFYFSSSDHDAKIKSNSQGLEPIVLDKNVNFGCKKSGEITHKPFKI